MRVWLRSVQFAAQGIAFALKHERNMRIHVVFAVLAILLIIILEVSKTEILFVLLALFMVMASELMNTAIEKTLDLAKPEVHPLAKAAKDCAAAAVLLCTIFAVIVGLVVFGPQLWEGPQWR